MPDPLFPGFVSRLFSGTVARGSMLSAGIKIVALGLNFFQAVLIARLLGPEGYGIVAVALSVASLAATLATLGLQQFAIREIARAVVAKAWGSVRGFILLAYIAVGATSCLVGVCIATAASLGYIGTASYRTELIFAAGFVPLSALLLITAGIFQGFGRVAAAQLPLEFGLPFLRVAGLAALIALGIVVPTTAVMALILIAAAIAMAIAIVWLGRFLRAAVPTAAADISARTWIEGGAPFLLVAFLGVALNEINTVLLGMLSNPEEAGLFQPLLRISGVMLIGLSAVLMAFAPRAAELYARGDHARLVRVVRMTTIATTLITALISAVVLWIAPHLLAIFGQVFAVNASSLLWIASAQIFNTACGPVGTLLIMVGHIRPIIAAQSAGLVTNVLLGLWLIPGEGALGAVLAMSGGIVVWNAIALIVIWRTLRFDPSLIGAVVAIFRKSST